MVVFLLHGTIGSAWNFKPLVRELEARGHKTYSIDYGFMALRSIAHCVREVRHAIDSYVQDNHVDTKECTIIGHSFGGMIAALVAEDMPFKRIIGLGACWRGMPPQPFIFRQDFKNPLFLPDLGRVQAELYSVISTGDKVVPAYTSVLPKKYGKNYWVYGYAHSHLCRMPEVADLVEE